MRRLLFDEWRAVGDCAPAVESAWRLMDHLYPLCRSITGEGIRATLRAVAERIPLEVTEVPSGTKAFEWEVPREWNIRQAWIKDASGRRVVDFADHNLHILNYSVPVHTRLSLEELRPHLHALPDHPDWIPYRTSYYRDDWGFCLTQRQLDALRPGEYEVFVDSTLEPGSLTYAECIIQGERPEEVLIFTHACHPSLCNDNLTGIALATELARSLAASRPHLTHRFVFGPGTIGSIVWLSRNRGGLGRIRHGLVIGLLGDGGPLTYKRSRRDDAPIDRIAAAVLPRVSSTARIVPFEPYGYDERQLCSPGFDLPVGRLTRTPNGEYSQYHTSADNFSIIDRACLAESLFACAEILRIADRDATYRNLSPWCEPRLGPRGLYRATGGASPGEFEHALLWVLNQSDGTRSLVDVMRRSGLPFTVLAAAADALVDAGLLTDDLSRPVVLPIEGTR
jgi:aminopeptidase-like protein